MADTFTSPTSDSSPSWLKQRTSIFNNATSQSSTINNTTNQPVVKKVVDKELASLKKIGAVSSVWSNKFVQEDNSGGTTENKKTPTSRNYNITSPPLHPLHTPSDPSLSPRRLNKVNTTPRPNADYIPVIGSRQSFSNITTTQPTSPRSPVFEKVRSLSGTKSMNDDILQAMDQQKQQSLSGYLSKASMSSLDLNDIEDSKRSSTVSSSNGFSSPPSRRSIDTDCTSAKTNVDEAAALWFQCETLKTQYAQNNARLNKATEDVEFYKRQLEQQGEISRQGISDAVEEKEKEVVRVRQLAELIVKQDKLLNEYQINLDILTQLTEESTYLEETQAEMNDLRQELISFKKQKEILEGTITALRAELEMSQSQMVLMMTVSTEIQNEFDNYKNKINVEIKDILKQKQDEHETELKAIQEQLVVPTTTSERSVSDAKENQELEALRDQIISLTEALEQKDKTVLDLRSQLRDQKMSMDTQMMELTQSILEKDALLMEFMSSRNNSKEVLPQQQQSRNMITTSVAPAVDTDKYYHPASPEHHQQLQQQQENHLQMSQIRDYMYDTSDDNDDDEEEEDDDEEEEEEEEEVQEQIHYTSEGEDEEETNTLQEINHYHQLMTHESSVPQSPADSISSSISSTISFDSSEEEEKVAEVKHFSYSSVQSQQTGPVSLMSSTESLTGGQDMMDDVSRRLSGVPPTSNTGTTNARFSVTKENSTNWPMPPPTPPPSEPLPPVPVVINAGAITASVDVAPVFTQEKKQEELPVDSMIPPPRRARSKTMARDEAPNMSLYTTSIHQTNELPRIIPLQRDLVDPKAPVPPPRKDVSTTSLDTQQQPPHTKWMDDPESEEDDMWCETNTSTVVAAL